MATKPASHTFTFSTDGNFSSGPASGNPTKVAPAGWPSNLQGFVPGLEYAAEYRNYLWNKMGDWTGWLNAGSSAGGADAHIVEVDASGNTALREIDLVGDQNSVLWRQTTVDNATPPDLDAEFDSWLLKGTLTANHDVTVFDSGASDTVTAKVGQRLRVRFSYGGASAFTVTLRREDTNALAVYTTSGSGVTPGWIEFEHDGSEWQVIGWDDSTISGVTPL